jgi:hypothetical protein
LIYEGECYLKTKEDRLKSHWAVLMTNDLYFYRRKNDAKHRVMHSLIGTFIKDMDLESAIAVSENTYYPLKILFPPNKARLVYFSSADIKT